ncbi:hypothetical protein C7M84_019681 [Penaeus vannamei]|uniref:Uncharacterized protein n=1 Tax=Penaeus vannamei TaxID=6689 RepID=A0A3R7QBD8_PENVA|nr:hypothetical protein C7M84_019681 [Penaeus vannamei]
MILFAFTFAVPSHSKPFSFDFRIPLPFRIFSTPPFPHSPSILLSPPLSSVPQASVSPLYPPVIPLSSPFPLSRIVAPPFPLPFPPCPSPSSCLSPPASPIPPCLSLSSCFSLSSSSPFPLSPFSFFSFSLASPIFPLLPLSLPFPCLSLSPASPLPLPPLPFPPASPLSLCPPFPPAPSLSPCLSLPPAFPPSLPPPSPSALPPPILLFFLPLRPNVHRRSVFPLPLVRAAAVRWHSRITGLSLPLPARAVPVFRHAREFDGGFRAAPSGGFRLRPEWRSPPRARHITPPPPTPTTSRPYPYIPVPLPLPISPLFHSLPISSPSVPLPLPILPSVHSPTHFSPCPTPPTHFSPLSHSPTHFSPLSTPPPIFSSPLSHPPTHFSPCPFPLSHSLSHFPSVPFPHFPLCPTPPTHFTPLSHFPYPFFPSVPHSSYPFLPSVLPPQLAHRCCFRLALSLLKASISSVTVCTCWGVYVGPEIAKNGGARRKEREVLGPSPPREALQRFPALSPALPFLLPYRTHSLSFPLFFYSSPIVSSQIYPDALFLNHFSLSLTFILPSSHYILSSFDILFPNHFSLSLTFIPPSSHYIPSYLDIFFANHFPLSLAHHSTFPNVVVIPPIHSPVTSDAANTYSVTDVQFESAPKWTKGRVRRRWSWRRDERARRSSGAGVVVGAGEPEL